MNTRIHIISAILSCRSKDWFRSGFFFCQVALPQGPGLKSLLLTGRFDWAGWI